MKAYYIGAKQKISEAIFIEPINTKERYVHSIYIPDNVFIGYVAGENDIVLDKEKPFLGAQEIVDGKRKGKVREIEIDQPALDKILELVPKLGDPEEPKQNHPFYNKVKSLVKEVCGK